MKHVVITLLALVVLTACQGKRNVEIGNKTTMEVDSVFDAGDVLKGEMITAKFVVKNTGEYPLWLAEVQGSCSCTVAEYTEDPIAPGETGEVLAHVDTQKTGAGAINKSVRIVANTNPSITQVIVKANVLTK